MRIGELLAVQISDISLAELKIIIYLREKNFQGRVVYYSKDADQALKKWLKIRPVHSNSLFPGRSLGESISYVTAWANMRDILVRVKLSEKGYSSLNVFLLLFHCNKVLVVGFDYSVFLTIAQFFRFCRNVLLSKYLF